MDARHEHASITTARHLTEIADLWPELEARLGKSLTIEMGGGKKPKKAAGATPVPIDLTVAEAIEKIQSWAAYLGRVLLDETDWKPPADTSTPSLLRDIGKWRAGHFTEHPDEMVALAFTDDCEQMRDLALKTARPSGARRIPLHVPCHEHGTNDQGERIPCPGEYSALLLPWRPDMPDMVCSEDGSHRMTPLEWQRAQRGSRRRHMEGLTA